MRKYISFFIFTLFFYSCTNSNNKNTIKLFNNLNIIVLQNESIKQINSSIEASYNTYFNNRDLIQIPIFKYIEGKNYQLFIGLPYQFTIDKIITSDSSLNSDSIIFCSSNKESYYTRFIKDSFCLTEKIERFDNNSYIGFFVLALKNSNLDSCKVEEILKNRITKD